MTNTTDRVRAGFGSPTAGTKAAATLAWLACMSAMVLMIVLSRANHTLDETSIFVALALAYSTVGAFIAARTNHPIGWLLCVIGFAFTLGTAGEQWVIYGSKTCPDCIPVISAFVVPGTLLWFVGMTALVLVFLLFPSGRLPEWHGRQILRVFLAAMVVVFVTLALRPSDPGASYPNPFALEFLKTPLLIVFGVAVGIALLSAAMAIAGLFIRFRRSTGIERQQMKWLSLVCITAAVLLLIGLPASFVTPNDGFISNLLWNAFFMCLIVGIPVAVGLAILRYRLYDIERIVSRTVSYGLVTAVLGGIFVLVAIVPAAVVGTEDAPDWITAVATLLVVALFRPVRRRIQGRVDRRFNRARYDAERTIEAFSTHLRDEVDLDALGAELRGVVYRTMQPVRVSLWLKGQS